MDKNTLKAYGDKLVIELDEEPEQTLGGIVLPETVAQENKRGKVLSVGDKVEGIKEGDTVLLAKHAFHSRQIDMQARILVVPDEDVIAIIVS